MVATTTGHMNGRVMTVAGWRGSHGHWNARGCLCAVKQAASVWRHGRGDGGGARCPTSPLFSPVLGLDEWYGTVQGLCMGLLTWIEESKGCETQSSNNKLEDEMYKAESPTYLNVG
ncbi:hypothetical protein SESBI_37470 [Sesbania bispinosa]|nr:hypothetical protein SESBI_37470 [Sesbania bispinosa]